MTEDMREIIADEMGLSYIPIDVVNEWLDCCNKYIENDCGLVELDKEMYKEG